MIKKLQWIRLILASLGLVFIVYASVSGNPLIMPYVNGIFLVLMAFFTMLLSAEMRLKGNTSMLTYFLFFFSIALLYTTLRTLF